MTATATLAPPGTVTGAAARTKPDGSTTAPIGSRLLTEAAELLPMVVGLGPVTSSDVHTALFEAAGKVGVVGRCDRLCLADQAQSVFVAYLVKIGEAVWRTRVSCTMHEWLLDQTPESVMHRLAECGSKDMTCSDGAVSLVAGREEVR